MITNLKSTLIFYSIFVVTLAMPKSENHVCPSKDICGNDGECVVTTHPLEEYKYACKCSDGSYKFESCSSTGLLIDAPAVRNSCATSPCGNFQCLVSPNFSNGYICVCGVNDYRTSCSSVTGTSSITLCPLNVCKNNAVCIVNSGSLSCICQIGFTGVFCEASINVQTTPAPNIATTAISSVVLCPNQNTCLNQGVCYLINGVTRCICPQGFTGTLCESAPTIIPTTIATTVPTTTQPAYILCTNQNTCKNQGVCYIVINSVTCVCPQGFTGQLCENSIAGQTTIATTATPAASGIVLCPNQNSCLNQGVCYLVNGVTRCVCPQGFSGVLCETSVSVTVATTIAQNGCATNPCLNGGTCVTQTNGAFFGCFCTTGYIGTLCQTPSGTGGNGGNQNICAPGRTGSNCETVYFSCTSNGRFKDQYLCSSGKYLECVYVGLAGSPNGILYIRDCPSGLRYNQVTDQCDFAVNIQC